MAHNVCQRQRPQLQLLKWTNMDTAFFSTVNTPEESEWVEKIKLKSKDVTFQV